MSGRCQITGKKPSTGRSYVRRGLAKAKGGVGRKIVGKTKRWFRPNLQRIKVIEPNGRVHRVWACAKVIKAGLLMKAPKQSLVRKLLAQEAAAKNQGAV